MDTYLTPERLHQSNGNVPKMLRMRKKIRIDIDGGEKTQTHQQARFKMISKNLPSTPSDNPEPDKTCQ